MKITKVDRSSLSRKIDTCQEDEAFEYGREWYTKFNFNDEVINDFATFFDEHVIRTSAKDLDFDDFFPVINIRTNEFYYIERDYTTDAWADIDIRLNLK